VAMERNSYSYLPNCINGQYENKIQNLLHLTLRQESYDVRATPP
jgi:hypothetical protein